MIKTLSRHISRLMAAAAVTAAAIVPSACSDELDTLPTPEGSELWKDGYISVSIRCQEPNEKASRGALDEPGIEDWNENLIREVVLCLWPKGGDRPDDTTTKPIVFRTFANLDKQKVATLRVPLNTALRNALFEDGSGQCNAYAAVNVNPGTAETVAALRNLVVNSEFDSRKEQPYFTMDGASMVSLSNDGNSAAGNIDVQRSAAKITLAVKVDESVTDDGVTWTPDLNGMSVRLYRGVKTATLTPVPADASDYFATPLNISYPLTGNTNDKDVADGYLKAQDMPFYTYPNQWENTPEDERRTYMILAVPWKKTGENEYRTCYYHCPVVPLTDNKTVRNTSYHIRLHVGMLGSFVEEEPLDVELSYTAANWSRQDIDVSISDYRYLVVDRNEYTVNNQTSISIPFYTSHETVVTEAKMTFYRFNFSDEGTKFPVDVTQDQNKLSESRGKEAVFNATFDNSTNSLNLTHELKVWEPRNASGEIVDLTNGDGVYTTRDKTQNETTLKNVLDKIAYFIKKADDNEYSKVVFTITVQHKDLYEQGSNNFKETVIINQYPAIYIDATKNFTEYINKVLQGTGEQASVYCNGNNSSIDKNKASYWKTSIGLSSNNLNWNPNMYLITITQLPENTEYTIGDPRQSLIDNELRTEGMGTERLKTWTSTSDSYGYKDFQDLDGKTRTLKYYYPTDERESNSMTIAPKFRICSSYAGTLPIKDKEAFRERGAGYQEMGYPAGRWRYPTYGEIKFIMDLSAAKKIPILFGHRTSDWYYWCAQGCVFVPQGYGTPKIDKSKADTFNARARYVYDSWYWGDDMPVSEGGNGRYPFRWGDQKRNNPQS